MIQKLLKSDFFRNVSTQMIGTGIAQLLPILFIPLFSRLYSEEEFGLFSSFLAYSAVLIVAGGGRYHIAIMLPKGEEEAQNVFNLSLVITFGYTLLLFVASIIVYFCLDFSLNPNGLVFLIPVYVGLFGIWQAYFNLSIRKQRFKLTSFTKVTQSLATAITTGGLGLLYTPLGLIFGKTFGVFTSVVHLNRKLKLTTIEAFSFKPLKAVATKYIDYPKYGIIPAFFDTMSLQALVFLIEYYYTKEDLGYYAFTNMCIAAPLGMIGVSFRDVFYQKIAYLVNENKIDSAMLFFKRSTLILFTIGLGVAMVFYSGGEFLFKIIFGDKWAISGQLASILGISFLVKIVASPLSSVLNATNNVKTASKWQFAYFLSTFTTLLLTIIYFKADLYTLLQVYVCHELILYSTYYILQYQSLKKLS